MYGSDVEHVLNEQGIVFQEKGKELLVDNCIFCNAKEHLYINRYTGVFDCKKCQSQGSFFDLKKSLGIIAGVSGPRENQESTSPLEFEKQKKAIHAHKTLMHNVEFVQQLCEWWGIGVESIKKYKLGICKEYNKLWLTIPTIEDGIVYNIKYRSWIGQEKEFRREKGGASRLFNVDQLNEMSSEYCLILEGEKDSITLLDKGYINVLGNSGGAGTFLPEWLKLLDKFEKIYICFDMDSAGDSGARKLVKRLGLDRCYKITLPTPGSDVNDFFTKEKYTKEEFDLLIEHARLFEVPGVVSMQDGYMELYNMYKDGELVPDVDTPWASLNKKLNGGFFNGDLITLSGPAKSLKTHLSFLIAEHNAKKGLPVLFYELEMKPASLIRRNVPRVMDTPNWAIDELDVLLAMVKQMDLPIYIGKSTGKINIHQVVETIKAVYKRYGIGLVVIDHAHLFSRQTDNIPQKLAELTLMVKQLAVELEIPIILLAQPNKIKSGQRMNYNDIGWSGTFGTDSDAIILLQRRRSDEISRKSIERDLIYSKYGRDLEPSETSFSPVLNVIVDAARQAAGGSIHMWFDESTFALTEFEAHEEFKDDTQQESSKGYSDPNTLFME